MWPSRPCVLLDSWPFLLTLSLTDDGSILVSRIDHATPSDFSARAAPGWGVPSWSIVSNCRTVNIPYSMQFGLTCETWPRQTEWNRFPRAFLKRGPECKYWETAWLSTSRPSRLQKMVVPTTACARDRAEAREPRLSIRVPADTAQCPQTPVVVGCLIRPNIVTRTRAIREYPPLATPCWGYFCSRLKEHNTGNLARMNLPVPRTTACTTQKERQSMFFILPEDVS